VRGFMAFQVARKLQFTKATLKVWNGNHFGNVRNRVKTLREALQQAQVAAVTVD